MSRRLTSIRGDGISLVASVRVVGSSGWIGGSSPSLSQQDRTGLRLGAGLPKIRSSAGLADFGAAHAPCRELKADPATTPRPPKGSRANMLTLRIPAEPS